MNNSASINDIRALLDKAHIEDKLFAHVPGIKTAEDLEVQSVNLYRAIIGFCLDKRIPLHWTANDTDIISGLLKESFKSDYKNVFEALYREAPDYVINQAFLQKIIPRLTVSKFGLYHM